jgi:maltose alpha-D-glucosyltransferase/alpha-amylase
LIDVATDSHFIATLLSDLRGSAVLQEGDHRIHFKPTGRLRTLEDTPVEKVRAVETEQSNSTTLVDERYVVKIYRKLENGLNPEVEVGRFLTDIAGFSNTPALLGSIELTAPDAESAVAIVHAFVENQGDAWTLTGTALDRFVEGESFVGTADTTPANDEKSAYQRYMMQTGRRVAEMQIALASRDDIEAFRPLPATADDVTGWIDNILSRSGRTFARLENANVGAADAPLVEQLLEHRSRLRDRLSALLPPPKEIFNIRHHGDFHLGQMLIVKEDIFIIDFEGEPRRPLVERRMKAPAARDVAGLIRSIDYSVNAALERSLKVKAEEHGPLQAALAQWRDESVHTFLTAYRAAMTDARLWPQQPSMADDLLQFFLLEKAFYEIEYELAHRPDWLRVALHGALRVLGEGVPA